MDSLMDRVSPERPSLLGIPKPAAAGCRSGGAFGPKDKSSIPLAN